MSLSQYSELEMNLKEYSFIYDNEKFIYETVKRVYDIILSLIGLIVIVPLVIIFGVLLKIDSQGSVIYKQKRMGHHGKVFTLYKLRSMYTDAEANGIRLTENNDSRITRIGRVIRRTRIDELPQVVNILKGEMSIVGPRPERPEYMYKFEREIPGYITRVSIKPGLTGWAQINGGYDISPSEKFKLDMDYIKNRNIILDVKIILMTFIVVFSGKGAR